MDIFYSASRVVVSEWKTNYWLVGLKDSLAWVLPSWNWVKLGVIVHYLDILFGTGLLVVDTWNWCFERL